MAEERQIPVRRMAQPAAGVATLTPKEIFGILRRHLLLIISLTILGFIIGGAGWYLLKMYAPRYTAKTFVRVLPAIEKDPMAIRSVQVNKDLQYGHRLSMAALITQQSTLMQLVERDKVQETKWFERFGKIRDVRIRKALKKLKKRFGAHAQRDGEFIILSMTCGDKKEAALIVNEMVDLFLASQGSKTKGEVAEKLARLTAQRDSVQKELNAAEASLDFVRRASGFADLEVHTYMDAITRKLEDLDTEQNDLNLGLSQLQSTIETLEKQATGPVGTQVERQIERDPVMLMLAQQLAMQESELAASLTKFGENHKEVRRAQQLINNVKQERAARKAEIAEQTRRSNLHNAQDQLTIFESRFEELQKIRQETEKQKQDFDAARNQYERRAAVRDERKEMLNSIKEQIEKLKIVHQDPETPKVQFAGYAPEPLEVSSPKWQVYFPGGTILGLMFGVGLSFLIELLNDLVRTPRDISRYLHIPLLGVIPDAEEDGQLEDIELCHVVRQSPYCIISESYRRFRTNLKLSNSAESSKTLLVSSGMSGDGKTAVAVNLATALVAENKKVLLVDANFWRPNLHTIFPKSDNTDPTAENSDLGLSTLLMGSCSHRKAIRPTGIEGFDIIDSGPLPSNPAELLGSPPMQDLIKQQRERYDYVIVDGPPLLLVSDSKTLARFVDGTILVFNAGTTRRGAAQRTIRELNEVDATTIGCVLFAVKAMKGGYFSEQFKYYQKYQKAQLAHSI